MDTITQKKVVRQRERPTYGKMRNVMPDVKIPKGYQGRWVNDVNDRISLLIRQGWDFLTVLGEVKPLGGIKDAKHVGDIYRKNVGGGNEAFLMVITDKWYKEDRASFHEQIAATKEKIRQLGKNQPGFYGGVTMTDKMPA